MGKVGMLLRHHILNLGRACCSGTDSILPLTLPLPVVFSGDTLEGIEVPRLMFWDPVAIEGCLPCDVLGRRINQPDNPDVTSGGTSAIEWP